MSDILLSKARTEKHVHLVNGTPTVKDVAVFRIKRIPENKYSPTFCALKKMINEKKDGTNAVKTQ